MDRAAKKAKKKEERAAKRAVKRAERKPGVLLQELGNLPNMLTVARILLIPLFVWFTYDADPWYSAWAGVIFTVAAITDVIDGWLARRWNMITVTGKLLDPLADKLIVTAALVMMVRLGRIGAWLVIILLAREFIVTGLRSIAANEGIIIAAGQEGKWKTSLQLVAIICLCVHYVHPIWLGFTTMTVDFNIVGRWLLYVATAMSVWSMVVYFRGFFAGVGKRGSVAG